MRLKRNQIPGGHKEVRASFPIRSQYKVSKIHTLNPNLEKRKGGREKAEMGARRRRGGSVLAQGEREKKKGERERG